MSGISGISGYNTNLLSLLSQTESGSERCIALEFTRFQRSPDNQPSQQYCKYRFGQYFGPGKPDSVGCYNGLAKCRTVGQFGPQERGLQHLGPGAPKQRHRSQDLAADRQRRPKREFNEFERFTTVDQFRDERRPCPSPDRPQQCRHSEQPRGPTHVFPGRYGDRAI